MSTSISALSSTSSIRLVPSNKSNKNYTIHLFYKEYDENIVLKKFINKFYLVNACFCLPNTEYCIKICYV